MSARSLALALLAGLGLAACAGPAVRPVAPAVDLEQFRQRQAGREAALAGLQDWRLSGRAAISQGDRGGSGRLEWRQSGPAFQVSLAAPVTRQSWQLQAAPGQPARLDGLEGGAREGVDPSRLLAEATGWDIPVQALAWWVRGLAMPGQDEPAYGPDGLPARLESGGWVIEYQEWMPASGPFPAMPRRLQASRGAARVRLVVDAWEAGQ